MELAHRRNIWRQNGNHIARVDAEGDNGGSEFDASGMGLGPCTSGVILENGRAIAIDKSSSFEETDWSKRA